MTHRLATSFLLLALPFSCLASPVGRWKPMARAPLTARQQHSAVWTGDKMFVFGGNAYAGPPQKSQAFYDPAQDFWSLVDTVGGPGEAEDQSVVWTGKKLLVWGGVVRNEHGVLVKSSGSVLDPIQRSWSPMRTCWEKQSCLRSGQGAVWTGTNMLMWGGVNPFGKLNSWIIQYDPELNRWANPYSDLSLKMDRISPQLFWNGNSLIIWGGKNTEGNPLYDGAVYTRRPQQPALVQTFSLPPIPDSQDLGDNGQAIWTGKELLIWGQGIHAKYNPTTDKWSSISKVGAPENNIGCWGQSIIWTGSKMAVWGGLNDETFLNSGGFYDPETDSWESTPLEGAPSPRFYSSAVWTGRDLIVWGGTGIEEEGNSDGAILSFE